MSFFSPTPTPLVYETPRLSSYEYHLLTIDLRKETLPDADQLNALGKDRWLLVNVLQPQIGESSAIISYYFVRTRE
jgi:hypothetical protein